jgi:prevent-host-death family protein
MSYVSYEMAEQKRISEARGEFSDLVNRAAYRHERVLLTRHGKAIAAIVPAEDLELLEALEDRDDLEAARMALADPDNQEEIPWEQVKADLGL